MADIDDPFKASDATVLRPRPGAGRRGAGAGGGEGPPVPPRAAAASYPDPVRPALPELLGPGLNPLVQAASSLLLLAGQLRGTLSVPDVAGVRRHATDEIRRFEERARSSGIQNEIVLAVAPVIPALLAESR